MRVEIVNEDLINIFINTFYFKEISLSKKIELIPIIKELLKKIESRYILNLRGFYKIKVYTNENLGAFLNIIKIDDNEFSKTADFRIVIYQNEKFLLKTNNYEDLPKNISKKFYNDKFYIDIDEINDIKKIIDLGDIIYGDDAKKVLMLAKNIS